MFAHESEKRVSDVAVDRGGGVKRPDGLDGLTGDVLGRSTPTSVYHISYVSLHIGSVGVKQSIDVIRNESPSHAIVVDPITDF